MPNPYEKSEVSRLLLVAAEACALCKKSIEAECLDHNPFMDSINIARQCSIDLARSAADVISDKFGDEPNALAAIATLAEPE